MGKGKKILVVDDEPDIVAVMKYTLECNGFEVITAYNGEEGIEKAMANLPDLVVLDVLMPKMSGDAVRRCLRDDPRTRFIPIVFLTNMPIDFLTACKNGPGQSLRIDEKGDVFLPKLVPEEIFLEAVRMCLGKNMVGE